MQPCSHQEGDHLDVDRGIIASGKQLLLLYSDEPHSSGAAAVNGGGDL